jgi:hypothetical protein
VSVFDTYSEIGSRMVMTNRGKGGRLKSLLVFEFLVFQNTVNPGFKSDVVLFPLGDIGSN